MQNESVYNKLLRCREDKGAGFLILIDPDSASESSYLSLAESAEECGVDAILVGSSLMINVNFHEAVSRIKRKTNLPVILFPSSFAQITPSFDAVLFSSLLSGRNPNYLIEEQVKGAPIIKKHNLETIPTGYMLIESGSLTSVQYISGTLPIPRNKSDIAMAHAMAGQYLGMKLIYLEAGSGAVNPVPEQMIRDVSNYIDIPIIVGGGLTTESDCRKAVDAGASFVVVGNHFETNDNLNQLRELTSAVHHKESQAV